MKCNLFKLVTIISIVLCFTVFSQTTTTMSQFVKAIHQVESSGQVGLLRNSKGAIGPLQIKEICWKDSGIKGSFLQVTNLAYAEQVFFAYLNKNCPKAVKNHDYETMARTWNGGPKGPKKDSTLSYWKRVKKELAKS